MTADLRAIQTWRTWRTGIIADDGAVVNSPMTSVISSAVGVHPYSAVALRMYGKDTENDTATLELKGWMNWDSRTASGPSQSLWKGQVLLGATTLYAAGPPIGDGTWAAGTWYEVDTYDIGVSGGHNAANAVVVSGGGNAVLILPTLGYVFLQMRVTDIGGGSPEMTALGAIYREVAMGGVV